MRFADWIWPTAATFRRPVSSRSCCSLRRGAWAPRRPARDDRRARGGRISRYRHQRRRAQYVAGVIHRGAIWPSGAGGGSQHGAVAAGGVDRRRPCCSAPSLVFMHYLMHRVRCSGPASGPSPRYRPRRDEHGAVSPARVRRQTTIPSAAGRCLGLTPWVLMVYELLDVGVTLFFPFNLRLPAPLKRSPPDVDRDPDLHRVHTRPGSPRRRNFGAVFPLWDRSSARTGRLPRTRRDDAARPRRDAWTRSQPAEMAPRLRVPRPAPSSQRSIACGSMYSTSQW